MNETSHIINLGVVANVIPLFPCSQAGTACATPARSVTASAAWPADPAHPGLGSAAPLQVRECGQSEAGIWGADQLEAEICVADQSEAHMFVNSGLWGDDGEEQHLLHQPGRGH